MELTEDYLIIGDLHLTEGQISSRVDNTRKVSLDKLSQIVDIAIERRVKFVICTGDFFHSTLQSKVFQREIIKILVRLRKVGIPFYTLTGNHVGDTIHRNQQSYKEKDLGVLEEDELIVVPTLIESCNGFIAFVSAYVSLESVVKSITEEKIPYVTQVVIHHNITPLYNDPLLLPVKDLKQAFPNLQVIWQGHDHSEFSGVIEGVTVIRPGSVLRTKMDKSSVRIPKVIRVSQGENWLEYIPLKTIPFTEAFAVDEKQEIKDYENELEGFNTMIGEAQNTSANIVDYIFEIVDEIDSMEIKDFIVRDLESLGIERRAPNV